MWFVTPSFSQGPAPPDEGVLVYGLYLDGASWDPVSHTLQELQHNIKHCPVPEIHFLPCQVEGSPSHFTIQSTEYHFSVLPTVLHAVDVALFTYLSWTVFLFLLWELISHPCCLWLARSRRMLWPCLLQSLLGTSSSMTVPCTGPSSGQASSPPQASLPTSSHPCLYLPTLECPTHWVFRGTALLCQPNEWTNSILTVYTKAMSQLITK